MSEDIKTKEEGKTEEPSQPVQPPKRRRLTHSVAATVQFAKELRECAERSRHSQRLIGP